MEKEKALAKEKEKLENLVKSLEENLTENSNKANKLKAIIEEKNKKIAEIMEQSTKYVTLEQNLTAELEKEKTLIEEKSKLEDQIQLLGR